MVDMVADRAHDVPHFRFDSASGTCARPHMLLEGRGPADMTVHGRVFQS